MIGRILLTGMIATSPVNSTLKKLERSYDSIKTIQAKFEQTYRSKRFDVKKSRGFVVIAKPGKMRWDYDSPKGRVFSSDGATLILYDPEDGQALVAPQPKKGDLPVALSFLWGEGKLDKTFDVKIESQRIVNGVKEVVLECTPKNPIPNVTKVYLTISMGKTTLVTGSKVVDAMGGETDLKFTKIAVNTKVNFKRFGFKPPLGTPVVNISSEQIKQ